MELRYLLLGHPDRAEPEYERDDIERHRLRDCEQETAAQRRAAEATMARRDRMEQGGRRRRAAARGIMPDFLQSDDVEDDADGGLLSGMKRRTRKQYDERRDADDMEGVEDVSTIILSLRI